MASPSYCKCTDDQGKAIEGPVMIPGREGTIEILGFQHEVYIPIDRDDGTLTGVRKHEPLVITKAFDSVSPYFYKACTNGQTLKEMVINWYKIDDSGKEVCYFTHRLEGVKITSIKPLMHNVKDIDKERYPHLEEVAMRYEKITWTYEDGNISFSDAWNEDR